MVPYKTLIAQTIKVCDSMEIYNISSDYVMARPECTDLRARYYLLSGDHSPLWGRGHYKLESFGFWGRKFCIKNVEILSVGKIAEFAKFAGGKRRKSPDRCLLNRAERVMNGRGLTGCRSVAEAAWQSSDTALPIGQVF